MISKKSGFLLIASLGLASVLAAWDIAAQPFTGGRSLLPKRPVKAIAIPQGQIDTVPSDIQARYPKEVIDKLPAAIWVGIAARGIDTAVLDSVVVADEVATDDVGEECPPLQFAVEFNQVECTAHSADHCSFGEQDCDPGFSEGQAVVTDGSYVLVWKTRNGVLVGDDCHTYSQLVPANGLGEFNAGGVHWEWDAPGPTQAAPAGFTALNEDSGEDAFAWVPESLGWISEARAGGSFNTARRGGRFNCKAYALGKCWQYKEIPYSYSCNLNGADASPR